MNIKIICKTSLSTIFKATNSLLVIEDIKKSQKPPQQNRKGGFFISSTETYPHLSFVKNANVTL
jgi:hypothetical protein